MDAGWKDWVPDIYLLWWRHNDVRNGGETYLMSHRVVAYLPAARTSAAAAVTAVTLPSPSIVIVWRSRKL